MKPRNFSSGSGSGINLIEFEAMKDTVWRLTCRVVSLETEISELKDRLGISENVYQQVTRPTRSKRNYQNHSTEISGLGIDPGDVLAVELNHDPNADGEMLHSFSDSEQEVADTISDDSNYFPNKVEKKPRTSVRKQKKPPRFGPDGKREKDFECDICHRKYVRNEYLQDHIRTHQGKTFSCMTCGSTFAYKSALRRHEKNRCKVKITMEELTCKLCHKVFNGKKNLGIHMRVHSDKGLRVKLKKFSNLEDIEFAGASETVTHDEVDETEYKADFHHHMDQIINPIPESETSQITEPECVPVITSTRSIEQESVPVILTPQIDFTHMIQL